MPNRASGTLQNWSSPFDVPRGNICNDHVPFATWPNIDTKNGGFNYRESRPAWVSGGHFPRIQGCSGKGGTWSPRTNRTSPQTMWIFLLPLGSARFESCSACGDRRDVGQRRSVRCLARPRPGVPSQFEPKRGVPKEILELGPVERIE